MTNDSITSASISIRLCTIYKNCIKAEEDIKQAMFINPHSPVVHNLYGILEGLLDNLARNHYRAACALDPTYKAAIHNLDRSTTLDNSYYGDHRK